jgi:hypothetical protein
MAIIEIVYWKTINTFRAVIPFRAGTAEKISESLNGINL